MADPIPDVVLQSLSRWVRGDTDDAERKDIMDAGLAADLMLADLARELLELREAARVFVGEFFGGDGTGAYDAAKCLRALLPKETA